MRTGILSIIFLLFSIALQAQLYPFYDAKKDKYGYVDKDINLVLPIQYDDATVFDKGYADVKKGKETYTIDLEGKRTERRDWLDHTRLSGGLDVYRSRSIYDMPKTGGRVGDFKFVDEGKDIVTDIKGIYEYSYGRPFLMYTDKHNQSKAIHTYNHKIYDCPYDNIGDAESGYCRVTISTGENTVKQGIIDTAFNLLIDTVYTGRKHDKHIEYIKDDLFVACKNKVCSVIDLEENILLDSFVNCSILENGYASVLRVGDRFNRFIYDISERPFKKLYEAEKLIYLPTKNQWIHVRERESLLLDSMFTTIKTLPAFKSMLEDSEEYYYSDLDRNGDYELSSLSKKLILDKGYLAYSILKDKDLNERYIQGKTYVGDILDIAVFDMDGKLVFKSEKAIQNFGLWQFADSSYYFLGAIKEKRNHYDLYNLKGELVLSDFSKLDKATQGKYYYLEDGCLFDIWKNDLNICDCYLSRLYQKMEEGTEQGLYYCEKKDGTSIYFKDNEQLLNPITSYGEQLRLETELGTAYRIRGKDHDYLIDYKGEVIFDIGFGRISDNNYSVVERDNSVLVIENEGKKYFYSMDGERMIDDWYSWLMPIFKNNTYYWLVAKGDKKKKYGVLDKDFKMAVDLKYDGKDVINKSPYYTFTKKLDDRNITDVYDENMKLVFSGKKSDFFIPTFGASETRYSLVRKDSLVGVLDEDLEVKIPFHFDKIYNVWESIFACEYLSKEIHYYTFEGKRLNLPVKKHWIIKERYLSDSKFFLKTNDFALYFSDETKQVFYINPKGEIMYQFDDSERGEISYQYLNGQFYNQISFFTVNKKPVFILEDGKILAKRLKKYKPKIKN